MIKRLIQRLFGKTEQPRVTASRITFYMTPRCDRRPMGINKPG